MRRRRRLHHRLPRRPAIGHRRADRRQRHRSASRARHRFGALPAHPHRPRPEGALRHAGWRAQSRTREVARSAASRPRPAYRIQPVQRRRAVRQGGAARGQRFWRRSAGLAAQVQGLGKRSRRLHLFHHPGAGVGRDLRPDRRADLEDRSGLCHAEGAPAAAEKDFRADRGLDRDQDQVRGHGHLQCGRYSGWTDPVDEGDCRGRVAAQDRHRRRSRSPDPRQISDRRQSDQAVGFARQGGALAAARRTHRGNPFQGTRLQRVADRGDQGLGRDHRAEEGRKSGVASLAPQAGGGKEMEERGDRCMRIVVHGQQAFGKAVLEALLKRGENVVGVYVAPEKEGAKADPLKEAALVASLKVLQPDSYKKPEVLAEFRALKPDLQVMAFVTLFVPEDFLNSPTHGSIQYHPSLLPAYRGASAINWPIIKGEKETGLSIFWPDNGLDTGDVLIQKKTPISGTDTLGTVYFDRLFPMGVEAMLEGVDLVKAGKAPRIKQDESKATYEGRCGPGNAKIDWGKPWEQIDRLIRGCNPAPAAWCTLDGATLQIFDAKPL